MENMAFLFGGVSGLAEVLAFRGRHGGVQMPTKILLVKAQPQRNSCPFRQLLFSYNTTCSCLDRVVVLNGRDTSSRVIPREGKHDRVLLVGGI